MADIMIYNAEDMTAEKMETRHLVLVDFWAPWCGPCRMMAPAFEEVAQETDDVIFAKMNIDENMEMAIGLGIASIPTLILFKDGVAAERAVGLQSKQAIIDMIARHR